jgi:hypothetical protein
MSQTNWYGKGSELIHCTLDGSTSTGRREGTRGHKNMEVYKRAKRSSTHDIVGKRIFEFFSKGGSLIIHSGSLSTQLLYKVCI